ncbi:glycosyltransferase [Catellatospora bangladeshensis]|uniref:glycosyltransferase n=1 Tax=Catellatospora bangladeshensis TaxID=310355 RepID=UPI0036159355
MGVAVVQPGPGAGLLPHLPAPARRRQLRPAPGAGRARPARRRREPARAHVAAAAPDPDDPALRRGPPAAGRGRPGRPLHRGAHAADPARWAAGRGRQRQHERADQPRRAGAGPGPVRGRRCPGAGRAARRRPGHPRRRGPGADRAYPGQRTPARAHPHDELFDRASAVVTHAGWGTVCRALVRGLPLVLVPIFADQPYIATRCAELGLGIALDADTVTATELRDAIRAVVEEPRYRNAAQEVAGELRAMAPLATAADLITASLQPSEG